jgi:hypothetical protein
MKRLGGGASAQNCVKHLRQGVWRDLSLLVAYLQENSNHGSVTPALKLSV